MTERTAEIERLLAACTVEERRAIFNLLRREFPIHTIEATLNIEAEIILDAISRSDDLTVRGVRGVIAQAAFALDVVGGLRDWRDITQGENLPYDFLLTDGHGDVRVQVKMQRQKNQRPMMANEGYRYLSPNMYVVETQRTRGGTDASGEAQTPLARTHAPTGLESLTFLPLRCTLQRGAGRT